MLDHTGVASAYIDSEGFIQQIQFPNFIYNFKGFIVFYPRFCVGEFVNVVHTKQ